MLNIKAGFLGIPFEHACSYDPTFITFWGKFWWLSMPMGLTHAPAHFQFVESVLCGELGGHPLPIVIYIDEITLYGDT